MPADSQYSIKVLSRDRVQNCWDAAEMIYFKTDPLTHVPIIYQDQLAIGHHQHVADLDVLVRVPTLRYVN